MCGCLCDDGADSKYLIHLLSQFVCEKPQKLRTKESIKSFTPTNPGLGLTAKL